MNAPQQDLYKASFQRNFGVITREEQEKLRNARVTVVGAGGVGGDELGNLNNWWTPEDSHQVLRENKNDR